MSGTHEFMYWTNLILTTFYGGRSQNQVVYVCVFVFIYLFPTYFNKPYSRHRNIGPECPQVNSEALRHGENFNSFQCLLHIFKLPA